MGYDFLVVGAGLTGATVARTLADCGKKVLVVDRRAHVAGNCRSYHLKGVQVHAYGPHIFHTNSDRVWNFVTRFAEFNDFRLKVRSMARGKVYSFPVNAMTLAQLHGLRNAHEVRQWFGKHTDRHLDGTNFESWCISRMGEELYRLFYYGYTKKMWGVEPATLPATIARRIPIRMDHTDRYYESRYEGIPRDGYTPMVERMLEGIETRLKVDFLADRDGLSRLAGQVVYTGSIDEFHRYRHGPLPYRTLTIRTVVSTGLPLQGCPIMVFPGQEVEHTRCVEHVYWTHQEGDPWPGVNVLSIETPGAYEVGKGERYYPIGTPENLALHEKYLALGGPVTFLGRLGSYRYLDMDQAVERALEAAMRLLARS